MFDWGLPIALTVFGLCVLYFFVRFAMKKARRALLMKRYDDVEMVDTIMEGRIARGMSAEMVMDVWGEPADMDETVLKTKTKREMKYDQKGKNRFGTRVYLENGVVIGWETK